MVEWRVSEQVNLNNVIQFAAKLAEWDNRIIEVASIDRSEKDIKIELICSFEPEPIGDNSGYVSVINLLLRNEHEGLPDWLGIQYPIDLGFRMDNKIYLADGEILNNIGEHKVLWSKNNE